MKKKPFDREKAKKELEHIIIEKIKEHYLKEHHKVKEKNEMSKKSDMDVLQIDDFVKKISSIPPFLGKPTNLIHKSEFSLNRDSSKYSQFIK